MLLLLCVCVWEDDFHRVNQCVVVSVCVCACVCVEKMIFIE